MTNRLDETSDADPWAVRIGVDAAATLRRSNRALFVAIGFLLVTVGGVMPVSAALPLGSDFRNYLTLGIASFAILGYAAGLVRQWRLRAKACNQAAIFLRLAQRTGERTLPGLALKNTTMFDNLMHTRGVSSEGRYVPHPSANWVKNNLGRFGVGKF